jgi:hypothetical protein
MPLLVLEIRDKGAWVYLTMQETPYLLLEVEFEMYAVYSCLVHGQRIHRFAEGIAIGSKHMVNTTGAREIVVATATRVDFKELNDVIAGIPLEFC